MVELNHRDRTIKVKLVYYGPPLGGKTTNLQVLHRCADPRRRGEMISINSAQDRTILFDLLPLRTPGFRGFDLRLQVLAVPGQAMYAATRRLVLKGADSLVFVANSALDRWEENIQSMREMTQNLISHHLEPTEMPLVFQYNKRDLPQVLEIEALDRALNSRKTDAIPAVAVRGEGVLETLTTVLARTAQDLATRYAILDVKEGTPARQWAEQAIQGLFKPMTPATESVAEAREPLTLPIAIPRLASAAVTVPAPPPAEAPPSAPPPPAPEPTGHTVVRVAPPPPAEDAARPAATTPEGRAAELVETYAEASAQLGAALTELREERDAARQRLDDLRKTMESAQQVLSGTPLESALQPVLAGLSENLKRGSFGIDEQSRTHLRNLDSQIGRLIEETARGRQTGLQELRNDIKKLAESQVDMRPLLSRLGDQLKGGGFGLDEQSRQHLRNLDVQIGRMLEDNARGRQEAVQELRSEIKVLARTIAALAEEGERR